MSWRARRNQQGDILNFETTTLTITPINFGANHLEKMNNIVVYKKGNLD
jgi:hypothetical protein